jgi:hypothetical protein
MRFGGVDGGMTEACRKIRRGYDGGMSGNPTGVRRRHVGKSDGGTTEACREIRRGYDGGTSGNPIRPRRESDGGTSGNPTGVRRTPGGPQFRDHFGLRNWTQNGSILGPASEPKIGPQIGARRTPVGSPTGVRREP